MTTSDETIRFSVSLPKTLLDELDQRVIGRGYASRSELVRDMLGIETGGLRGVRFAEPTRASRIQN